MFSGEYAEGNANPTASDCDMDIHSDQSGPGFDDSILDVDDSDIEQEEKGTPSKDPLLDVNIKTVKIADFSQVLVLTDSRRL